MSVLHSYGIAVLCSATILFLNQFTFNAFTLKKQAFRRMYRVAFSKTENVVADIISHYLALSS